MKIENMKKPILAVLASLLPLLCLGQIVNIPDANFKNACVNFGIVDFDGDGIPEADVDTNDDGEIQVSEALAVERMYPRGTGIQSLVGIEEFANLQIFNCSMNGITEMDLSQNLELIELSCFINNLTSLNVTQNSNLAVLNCDLNNLTTLDVTGNPLLERLTCPDNELTELNISQNPLLKTLTADMNQLTSLDFTQNPALEVVSFDNNQISAVDFSLNPNLSIVDIYNNNLTSLDISQNPLVTKLWCYNNDLQSLNIKNGTNTAMTIMRAEGNSSLTCVQVDDAIFAGNQPSWMIDATASYNENCNLAVGSFSSEMVTVYPIPARDEVYFSISEAPQISAMELLSLSGASVLKSNVINGILDVSQFTSGTYFLRLSGDEVTVVKRIVIE